MEKAKGPLTVDEYIASKPAAIQPVLQSIRALIRAVIPEAKEVIAWGMPSYKGRPYIVHFAAHKAHLGLYPGAEAMVHFQDRLRDYHTSKGAVQFLYEKPLPEALITDMVRYCAAQDAARIG